MLALFESGSDTDQTQGAGSGGPNPPTGTRAMVTSGVVLAKAAQDRRWMPPSRFEGGIAHLEHNLTRLV